MNNMNNMNVKTNNTKQIDYPVSNEMQLITGKQALVRNLYDIKIK